jgi:hypothetical protein
MSQIGYRSQVLLKIRCEEIERKLLNDESLLSGERQALLVEKTRLYARLYPEIEEEDDEI